VAREAAPRSAPIETAPEAAPSPRVASIETAPARIGDRALAHLPPPNPPDDPGADVAPQRRRFRLFS
jgi:hypothetical protein